MAEPLLAVFLFFLEIIIFIYCEWPCNFSPHILFTVVEDIHKKREPLCTMDGIYLITPAQKSVDAIINDFAVGNRIMYRAAHVFFTEGAYLSHLFMCDIEIKPPSPLSDVLVLLRVHRKFKMCILTPNTRKQTWNCGNNPVPLP